MEICDFFVFLFKKIIIKNNNNKKKGKGPPIAFVYSV